MRFGGLLYLITILVGCSNSERGVPNAQEEAFPSSGGDAWNELVHSEVLKGNCVACHHTDGIAGGTALVFSVGTGAAVEPFNMAVLDTYVLSMGGQWTFDKARGLNGHGGGQRIAPGTEDYLAFLNYLESLTGGNYDHRSQQKNNYVTESPSVTYRRASLLLTGEIPNADKLAFLARASDSVLRQELLDLMQGEGFRAFLKRGANDQLLVRSLLPSSALRRDMENYYPVFQHNFRRTTGTDRIYERAVMAELAEAPLELIAHIVLNNRPYSEVLTANYTMVSTETASVFKTGLTPAQGEFVKAVNAGQHISGTSRRRASDDWAASTQISIPHAGILTEPAFLQQYPTTETNRNRARARWTYMHFLGVDIEALDTRTISNADLQDIDNPTQNLEACTVCHTVMDPVAGAFQNFGANGIFRSSPYGTDSLEHSYKKTKLYRLGDTWYSDMLAPGFNGLLMDNPEASVQQLAHHIVQDPRFANGAVKFWWPAIFGELMLGDDLSTLQLSHKLDTLAQLSEAFVSYNFDLRELLADIIMSDWFRIYSLQDAGAEASDIAYYTGGRRLLTPEELSDKTASLSSVVDPTLTDRLNIIYGGIDSVTNDRRQRDFNHMMSRVAERHALSNACTIIASEFNSDQSNRKLFTLVEREDVPGPGYRENIVLPSTESLIISHSIDVKAVPYQSIHYAASQFVYVHERSRDNNIRLQHLEIIKPDGSVLINGNIEELYDTYQWVTGTPAEGVLNPYRIRKGRHLSLDIPVDMSGEYRINMTVQADVAASHLDISLQPSILLATDDDPSTIRFRQQIARLVERMHGQNLPHSASKIVAYTQLFLDLRANRVARDAPRTLAESGIRCDYDSGDVPRSLWGADPHYALGSWRGVVVALMTDFDYIFE